MSEGPEVCGALPSTCGNELIIEPKSMKQTGGVGSLPPSAVGRAAAWLLLAVTLFVEMTALRVAAVPVAALVMLD